MKKTTLQMILKTTTLTGLLASHTGYANHSPTHNLLASDGTFEQGQQLYSYYYALENGQAIFTDTANFTVDSTTPNPYDIQLIHPTSVMAGQEYSLCYDAKASGERTIYADIDTGGPTTYGSLTDKGTTSLLDTAYQSFKITFIANATDTTARVVFHLGGNTTEDVQLDNIGLYAGNQCASPAIVDNSSTSSNSSSSVSVVDANFHIYLAFGQSNMEGTASFSTADNLNDPRAQLIQNLSCPNLSRTYGQWYTAQQPYFGCWGQVGVANGFLESLLTHTPSSVSIGLVPIAIGGSDIGLYRKGAPIGRGNIGTEKIPAHFDGGYSWLLDLAKQAQQRGVIKGIIFHQGETNTSQQDWKNKVKEIVNDLKQDLTLGEVPFLAGELLYQAGGGCCDAHNLEVNKLPSLINNAHVISAQGLQGADNAHFTYDAYKIFGQRYANKMAELIYPSKAASTLKKRTHIDAYQASKRDGATPVITASLLKSDGTFRQGQQLFSHFYLNTSGSASFNGEANFTITQVSKNTYDIQLIHRVGIQAGEQYTLCYDAKASQKRTIVVDVDTDEPDYASLTHQKNTHYLSTDYQTFTFTFTATATDEVARIGFHLGGQSLANVQLDNIGLYLGNTCLN